MQHLLLNKNKFIIAGSLISALVLTFTVISPALVDAQQDMLTQTNCANLQYPSKEEPTILTDTETGLINISYTDSSGTKKQTQLNFKKDNPDKCSNQGRRILTDVKEYQAKYNSDMCNEMTEIVEGKKAMPVLDEKRPTMDQAKAFQRSICAMNAQNGK
ncbi:MAG TPA: hypothetical protein VFM02_03500 [Candidatus Paceibacterota bacterium]|nr:hypothetical protein [Candidatus Paceibacterota bacterium]